MRLLPVLIAISGLCCGCATQGGVEPATPYSPEQLKTGAGVLTTGATLVDVPVDDILSVDDDMRGAVADWVGDQRLSRTRLRKLISGMLESGLLSLDYKQAETKTAAQTFHSREGNCLAFTNLFVALGREAGLDVGYQVVDVPPFWYAGSDTVVLANHINAVVRVRKNDRTVVDFNAPEYRGEYDTREVSDAYAFALFYNNIGMDRFGSGDLEAAYAYLRAALDADPHIAAVWINLGVLYLRKGYDDRAEAAYAHALRLEPTNRSALTNLAYLYRGRGDHAQADYYAEKVQRYQNRNPYYHFINAQQAHADGKDTLALELVDRAIRMKKSEHRFHFLKARILATMDRADSALASLRTARELVTAPSLAARYDQKISFLSDRRAR